MTISSRTPLTPRTAAQREALEAKFGQAMKHRLDASTQAIKPDIARRLAESRRTALVQMNSRAARATVQTGGGTLAQTGGWSDRITDPTFWGAGLLVAMALAMYAGTHFDSKNRAREAAEADVEILSSDVPMDAYFDKGFKTWVQQGQ